MKLSNGTKINKTQFNKWITALRSGKYAQGQGCFQDLDGFCCLGVACKVVIPEKKQQKSFDGLLAGGTFQSHQNNAPLWLKQINQDFSDQCSSNGVYTSLVDINDGGLYNFDEIADMLELVYVHKALG